MARDPDTGGTIAEPGARAAAEAFRVTLPPLRPGEPPFEGPLDLILHLVKEHEVDLFDIPIARITEGYLATLEALRELDIDVAGEFLHMAAQLVLMKSKLLLPRTEVAEDAPGAEDAGVDPRAELVRRLLEYQKYKAAGEELGGRDILDRTVFARRARAERPAAPEGPEGLADVSVFKLIEALDRALAHARPETTHEIFTDRLTISDAIARVAESNGLTVPVLRQRLEGDGVSFNQFRPPGACLYHHPCRRAGALSPPAGRGGFLPHRCRRARPEGAECFEKEGDQQPEHRRAAGLRG